MEVVVALTCRTPPFDCLKHRKQNGLFVAHYNYKLWSKAILEPPLHSVSSRLGKDKKMLSTESYLSENQSCETFEEHWCSPTSLPSYCDFYSITFNVFIHSLNKRGKYFQESGHILVVSYTLKWMSAWKRSKLSIVRLQFTSMSIMS